MNIAATIIEIRKQRKMTQEDFAKLFHVTRQTVSNWENEKSYPDIKTLVEISDEFDISLDRILKEDTNMVKKIDGYRFYKKVFMGLITGIVILGIFGGIYIGICKMQHKKMYDKVLDSGFTNEYIDEDLIERYQGFYALTEDGVDYLVIPKSIGKYELDTEKFYLFARKGNKDLTIIVDRNRKIKLALYLNGGNIEIDESGNIIGELSKIKNQEAEELLKNRKKEILPIIDRALELWDSINE